MFGKDQIKNFKKTFLTGLAALFPILITLFLLSWLYGLLDSTVGVRVNSVCRAALCSNTAVFKTFFPGAPAGIAENANLRGNYAEEHFRREVGVLVGLIGLLVIAYLLGVALRGYIGAKVVKSVDGFFGRFPLVRVIYPPARQIADLIFNPTSGKQFRQVVAIQYPRKGVYTVGFLTGEGVQGVEDQTQKDLKTVFIPTAPTPLTGFVVLVPSEEVIALDMTVEEAFRYCMTAGMIAPGKPHAIGDGGAGSEGKDAVTGPIEKEIGC